MPIAESALLCLALFAGMLVLLEAGFRFGMRYQKTAGGQETGILDGAILALLGLLLGFAFAGGVDRLNLRRDLVIKETNAIRTAYLRIDVLEAGDQPPIRALFREYLGARLSAYQAINAGRDAPDAFHAAEQLQSRIWSAAAIGVNSQSRQYTAEVVLPAINDMIGVTIERKVMLSVRLPVLILALLCAVSLLSALLAGNGMARSRERHLLHGSIFAAAVSLTVYTILDLDNPRAGLIRLDAADRVLEELRELI